MQSDVLKEHQWLHKFIGEWDIEGEAVMVPGQPPEIWKATESVRGLGGLWIQGEGNMSMPDGGSAVTQLTLGYDPQKQRYVGTWLGSMMSYLWIYEGSVDAGGTILTLDTTGPDMSSGTPGKMIRFQDIWEFKSDDHRILTSQTQAADGSWQRFMTAHYRRRK